MILSFLVATSEKCIKERSDGVGNNVPRLLDSVRATARDTTLAFWKFLGPSNNGQTEILGCPVLTRGSFAEGPYIIHYTLHRLAHVEVLRAEAD